MNFFSMPGPFIGMSVCVCVCGGGGDRPSLGMSTHMTFFSMHGPFIDVSMSVCVEVGETGYHRTHDEVLHACAIHWCISVCVCGGGGGGGGRRWATGHIRTHMMRTASSQGALLDRSKTNLAALWQDYSISG